MAEGAAHFVDHVFPDVPVRQWVPSLPYRLRYRLAWDHDLCRAVVAVYMRAVLGWLRNRARLDDVADGRGGAVAIVQRGAVLCPWQAPPAETRKGTRGRQWEALGDSREGTAGPVIMRSLLGP